MGINQKMRIIPVRKPNIKTIYLKTAAKEILKKGVS